MKKFKFSLKHEKGILNITVNSISKVEAIKFVLTRNNNKFEILSINQI